MSSSSSPSSRHEQTELSRSASQDTDPTEVSASGYKLAPRQLLETGLYGLYSESTVAKIWKVAAEGLIDGVRLSISYVKASLQLVLTHSCTESTAQLS